MWFKNQRPSKSECFFFFKTRCQQVEAKSRATYCECASFQKLVCRSLNRNLEYSLLLRQCYKCCSFSQAFPQKFISSFKRKLTLDTLKQTKHMLI